MESNVIMVSSVFSMVVPGGMLTLTNIIPLSSSGTNPDGVDLNKNTASPLKPTNKASVIHFLLTKVPMVLVYLLVIAVKPTLKALKKRAITLDFLPFSWLCGFKNKAAKAGLKVKALTADIKIATANVIPNCW